MKGFEDLVRLGFNLNEAKVYVTLLNLGPSLAGAVARGAQLERSSTYNALKALQQRGIVSTIHENKRMIFVPASPEKITDYFEEKQMQARNLVPELASLYKATKGNKQVSLYKGYKGLKTVFDDMIKTMKKDDTCYIIGSEGRFSETMPHYAPMFRKRKEEANIKTKLLVRKDRPGKARGKLTQVKTLPLSGVSPSTITVYDGKIAIIMWDEDPQAIIIEHDLASRTFKELFGTMWQSAKS